MDKGLQGMCMSERTRITTHHFEVKKIPVSAMLVFDMHVIDFHKPKESMQVDITRALAWATAIWRGHLADYSEVGSFIDALQSTFDHPIRIGTLTSSPLRIQQESHVQGVSKKLKDKLAASDPFQDLEASYQLTISIDYRLRAIAFTTMAQHIQEALSSRHIRPFISPSEAFFFFVEKKDGNLNRLLVATLVRPLVLAWGQTSPFAGHSRVTLPGLLIGKGRRQSSFVLTYPLATNFSRRI
ncbi:peptidyl-prolyl cis-trans isomerase FKBP10 [Tachysurus ichikawai]